MPAYFYEISQYIESKCTDPDTILKGLYDTHLQNNRPKSKESGKLSFFSTYSRPAAEKNQPPSTLDTICDLYHGPNTKKSRERIISVLNAYVNYFPAELKNLHPNIRKHIKIIKPSDILARSVHESLLFKTIASGNASGIDDLLCALPNKGTKIVYKAFLAMSQGDERTKRKYLNSFAQIPQTIAALPIRLKYLLLPILVADLNNTDHPTALIALSESVSLDALLKKYLSTVLHKLLYSEQMTSQQIRAAYSLNRLVQVKVLDYSDKSKKIIAHYNTLLAKQADSPCFIHYILPSLEHLANLVALCDVAIVTPLITGLCDRIHEIQLGSADYLKTLCALSPAIAHLPETVLDVVVTSFIRYIPLLSLSHDCDVQPLQFILKKKPSYVEQTLLALLDELFKPEGSTYKLNILGGLFSAWHNLLDNMKPIKIMCLNKLFQYFKDNEPSLWMTSYDFSVLIACFKDLPEEALPLVTFFTETMQGSDEYSSYYAIEVLGFLHFSLGALPDAGLSVVQAMNHTLTQHIQNKTISIHTDLLISSLAHMSDLLGIHDELINDVFMNLLGYAEALEENENNWLRINHVCTSTRLLQKQLDHPSLNPEYKQRILTFLENNILKNRFSLLENIHLLSQYIPKEILLNKFFQEIDEYDQTDLLAKISSDIKNHPQQLSWVCVLSLYLKKCVPEGRDALIPALGVLFSHLKKQESLSESFLKSLSQALPQEMVTYVADYVGEDVVTFAY